MQRPLRILGSVALTLALGACSRNMPNQPKPSYQGTTYRQELAPVGLHQLATVFTASGDITPAVAAYRLALGGLNPNTVGSASGGRREINWDAVPAAFTNTNTFPADFFNQPVTGRARGVVFSTPGTGFRTSDNNFADLNPDFGHEFVFFSPIRTFAAVGDNNMTVRFFVPGSNDAAVSTGFGVVFSDVDLPGSAAIQLFDAAGNGLGRYLAPTSPSGGLSFVGVKFPSSIVARVEIRSGQGAVALGANDVDDRDKGKALDLVIMDDFIYGEPQIVSGAQTANAILGSGNVGR